MTETVTKYAAEIRKSLEEQISKERWERIQTSTSKVRIMQEGARTSSGAIADVQLRNGRAWIANRRAAVIAAAPEMLDALLAIAAWEEFATLSPYLYAKVNIAIAKAEQDGVAKS